MATPLFQAAGLSTTIKAYCSTNVCRGRRQQTSKQERFKQDARASMLPCNAYCSCAYKHYPRGCSGQQWKRRRKKLQSCAAFRVTPYKLKEGESLEKVAKEHGMDTQELLALNHELDPDSLGANPHILVPQGRVSDIDRLVLHNMKTRRYRTYAAKQNESVEDIIGARNITREEVEGLNPDVDLDNLADHEIIKLPAHKYSPHEQNEMHGTLGGPEAFSPGSWLANTLIVGGVVIAWYCAWLFRQSRRAMKQAELERKIAASRKKYRVPPGLPNPSYLASVDEANEDSSISTAQIGSGRGDQCQE